MPTPRINNKTRERPTYNDLFWEQLQDTKTEVRETRKELNARMDKLEENLNARMDNIEQRMDKLDARIDKLGDKIDKLADKLSAHPRDEIKSSSWQLYAVDFSMLVLAFSVIYLLVFK